MGLFFGKTARNVAKNKRVDYGCGGLAEEDEQTARTPHESQSSMNRPGRKMVKGIPDCLRMAEELGTSVIEEKGTRDTVTHAALMPLSLGLVRA